MSANPGQLQHLHKQASEFINETPAKAGQGPPGVLNTYRVIAEPVREHYDSELDWKVAKDHAGETRRMLTSSVLRSMLPRQMQDHVLTEVALLRAVGKVHATHTSSTTYVVDELASFDGGPTCASGR